MSGRISGQNCPITTNLYLNFTLIKNTFVYLLSLISLLVRQLYNCFLCWQHPAPMTKVEQHHDSSRNSTNWQSLTLQLSVKLIHVSMRAIQNLKTKLPEVKASLITTNLYLNITLIKNTFVSFLFFTSLIPLLVKYMFSNLASTEPPSKRQKVNWFWYIIINIYIRISTSIAKTTCIP